MYSMGDTWLVTAKCVWNPGNINSYNSIKLLLTNILILIKLLTVTTCFYISAVEMNEVNETAGDVSRH